MTGNNVFSKEEIEAMLRYANAQKDEEGEEYELDDTDHMP